MSGMSLRALALVAALLFVNGTSATPSLATLSNTQSAVTVKVTPRVMQGDTWEFDIIFDTHSQELKDDLLESATLVPADGSPVPPTEWKGDPPGGHHRKGVLRFNAIKPTPASFELRIERPGERQPRLFRWTTQ
ncbi:hypothetical protein GCM10027343_24420 [Noviherbaspirillum agri]